MVHSQNKNESFLILFQWYIFIKSKQNLKLKLYCFAKSWKFSSFYFVGYHIWNSEKFQSRSKQYSGVLLLCTMKATLQWKLSLFWSYPGYLIGFVKTRFIDDQFATREMSVLLLTLFGGFVIGNLLPEALNCERNLFFERQGRIVNGAQAVPKSWPWIGKIFHSKLKMVRPKIVS